MSDTFPRPLTELEASVLEFLLSIDFPGRAALVEQARSVEAVGRWDGEPTIELHVTATQPRRAEVEHVSPVEATTWDGMFDVVLFVGDGELALIELVDNTGQGMPDELPAPVDLAEPTALGPTAARLWWQPEGGESATGRVHRQRQRELRALIWEWDPLGILGVAESEYDCIADPVLAVLSRGGADAPALQRVLGRQVLEMGQDYSESRAKRQSEPEVLEPVAARILAWWQSLR